MALRVELDHVQSRALPLLIPGTVAVFPWGRGAGKTFFDKTILYKLALENPGIELGLLLPTLKRAKQIFWPALFNDFHGSLKPYIRKLDASLLEAQFRNGSRLTTWGAENADGIRGQRFGAIVQDETDEIDASVEHAVVEPTFSKSGTRAIWLKTGTPKRGRLGILYRDFKRAQEGFSDGARRYVGFRVRSSESPQVDQAWLASVKATTPTKIFSREYECDFDSAEGLVYGDVYESLTHERTPPADVVWSEILIGGDYGYEDPGVLLLIGILGHGRDAVAWVLDEVYQQHRTEDWWLQRMRQWLEWYPEARVYHDPSAKGRVEAYRKHCRARIQDVDNSIEDGVATVADFLFVRQRDNGERHARIYISPACVNTIREFGLYRRKKDPRSSGEDPVFLDDFQQGNDHAMDALRYALHNRFGGQDMRRAGTPAEALG
jgi:hypothetical protein